LGIIVNPYNEKRPFTGKGLGIPLRGVGLFLPKNSVWTIPHVEPELHIKVVELNHF